MTSKDGLPILSGEYNRGYAQAILDLTDIFLSVQDDCRHHHKQLGGKAVMEVLKVALANRESMREAKFYPHREQGFIRWNRVKGEFEWYEPVRGRT